MEHRCKRMEQSCQKKRDMGYELGGMMGNVPNFGDSIRHIEHIENLNIWVAHCDEYATIIEYCPFCGVKLHKDFAVLR